MLLYNENEPIEVLELSVRSYNALKKGGINTIKNLLAYPRDKFKSLQNIGAGSVNEILLTIEKIEKNDINYQHKKDYKTFIGIDGVRYFDIKIEDLEISVRAQNCLKGKGLDFFSQILDLTDDEINNIKNLGLKTLEEIKTIKNKTLLTETTEKVEDLNINEYTENIFNQIFKCINVKININGSKLYDELNNYLNENEINIQEQFKDNNINEVSLDLIKELYNITYIETILKTYIIENIRATKYGINEIEIIELMPKLFNDTNLVNHILLELLIEEKITFFEDRYIYKFMPFKLGVESVLKGNEFTVFNGRIEGKTLEEIGEVLNITRERVRQIESDALKRINKLNLIFSEDIFEEVYRTYELNFEDFAMVFEDISVFFYLELRYSKQIKNPRMALINALDDKRIPLTFRKNIEKIVYKNHVRIGGKYIPCTRAEITNYVLQTYAVDSIRFEEFVQYYMSVLEDIKMSDDPKLALMDRGYENKLASSKNVLNSKSKNIRYYDSSSYDFTTLLDTLNLNQYMNIEYSTLKFFKLFPELMKEFDIRDEYELHNLLKMICGSDEYPNVNFKRMPNIEFGEADKEYQMLELILSLAPISKDELANKYEDEYGVYAPTVMANILGSFDEYFHDGIYNIDAPELPNDAISTMLETFVDDFYFITDIKNYYTERFPNYSINLLNPLSIKKLGFKVYANYIISDKYSAATDYFSELLTKNDVVYVDRMKEKIKEVISFRQTLYRLKNEYILIEFSPNRYVNFSKLVEEDISIADIHNFVDSVLKFTGFNKFFTIRSIRNRGFAHRLFELGFEDWFYTSIIIEQKERVSSRRVAGTKIIYSGILDFTIKDLIESIIFSQPDLRYDIYELVNTLKEDYGINTDRQNILTSINNSSMFYDPISENVYADYDVYFEEI